MLNHVSLLDTGCDEVWDWPFTPGMDSFPEPLNDRFPGVSKDKVAEYIAEVRSILRARYAIEDAFPETVRIVRSKHVLWKIRDTPETAPTLSRLPDREVLRIVSMILKDMHQVVVNNKNRGKFLVTPEATV